MLQRIDSLADSYPEQASLPDIRLHDVRHGRHLEVVARISEGHCCLLVHRLRLHFAAGRMCGGRSSGADIAAVATEEEGSFVLVVARLAAEEADRIEHFLAG